MARRRKRSREYIRPDHWSARVKRWLRVAWLALCLGALAGWWLGWGFVDGAGERVEHRDLLDTMMGIIAFPAGLLWVWVAPGLEPMAQSAALASGVPESVWRGYGPELLTWLGATAIGYFQWFWLLPHVFTLRADG